MRDAPSFPWTSRTPSWQVGEGNGTVGNGSLVQRWRRTGDGAFLIVQKLLFGTSTAPGGSSVWSFDLPGYVANDSVDYYPMSAFAWDASAATPYACGALLSFPSEPAALLAYYQNQRISSTWPFTWAVGDYLVIGNAVEAYNL